MANLPVRNLGGVGVVTDVNPYDLPSNAFSDARNVIFDNGKVSRSPVFKKLFPTPTSGKLFSDYTTETFATVTETFENAGGDAVTDIRFVSSYEDPTDGTVALVVDKKGEVRAYPNGDLEFVTPISGTLVTNEEPWSHSQVAGISVLSRAGMVPYGRKIDSDTEYEYLSGDWSANDTCSVVRGYKDFLIALNVNKNAIEYPTMVKWSGPIQIGTEVANIQWDPTDPTSSAGENILGDARTPILDGLTLGSQFVIYSADEVYLMEYTGSSLVFNFRRLFATGGILNKNCVVEVNGKHYVFGSDDIYMHDGISRKSIADGRVRAKIYNNLVRDDRSRYFVIHDSLNSFIYFCYKTPESNLGFVDTEFCNKAAVYNYANDTWSFMDLPNIVGGAEITYGLNDQTYPGVTLSYQDYNTPYSSFASDTTRLAAMVSITDAGNGISESRTFGLDLPSVGKVSISPETEVTKEAFVERIGIDLDETNLPLRAYKTILSITPQANFLSSEGSMTLKIGSTDNANNAITWRTEYSFRPDQTERIDTRASGKYLAYRLSMNDIEDFTFSGFDAEVVSTSKR
jgi:hypothetical protein